ncbi:acetyl-CoA acetyltransferase [Desulfotomaculum copahuensis]|uniref:Acetyl-CoA acetyltransferase n=2 Tax=Desulfotomaculum copahuensis TaxID=1838280 RepID=A0A1B7LAI2_9FIRM|nr:acetyl-CoA acetyltransferase [Desulfotomaculum copahuensis]
MGMFKDITAVDLGVIAAKEAIKRAGISAESIDEVVAGMVCVSGTRGNPARQVQLKAGIPFTSPAATVNQLCGSGMRATEIVYEQIALGHADTCLAVGMENMTQAPYIISRARQGYRMGDGTIQDSMLCDALIDPFLNYHMGVTAENLASKYNISRQEQDELAYLSHKRAVEAIKSGKFKDEIVPVIYKDKKGEKILGIDEHPRFDISVEKMAELKPIFRSDGTVTAANASGINDGAAALVLMAREKAAELGIKPIARVVSSASAGVPPEIMGIGPAYSIPKALKFTGLTLEDIDYFEINEAFAAQFLAVNRELKIDMENVNANGSGIALGHPIGCTGVRIIVTLLYEMVRRNAYYGVASLCVGGGPSIALVVERL